MQCPGRLDCTGCIARSRVPAFRCLLPRRGHRNVSQTAVAGKYLPIELMRNWKNIQYLQTGNSRQQRAHAVLQELGIWGVLRSFDPVLAGTIPLAIDLADSDLDIICEVMPGAQEPFKQVLRKQYGHLAGFRLAQVAIGGHDSVVSSFRYAGVALEVFGQALPTEQQHAFRHLVVEYAVLQAGGEVWRAAVQQLKQRGLKTEPAFAALLQLPGNPYDALLTLEGKSPAELAAHLANCPTPTIKSRDWPPE